MNERDFEHLTQALALKVLGPGVEVFGDGPDGGREATFAGRLSFPTPDPDGPWDGYGVLQAKFHYRPRDPQHNAEWLRRQLNEEFDKWVDPASRRTRRPEYFLVATNVVLSPYPQTGGIDQIAALMDERSSDLGLKGWHVWHYDKLCRLLDGHAEIARRYYGLITPGDILARLRDYLDGQAGQLTDVLIAHAGKELLADRLIRLEKAGDTTDEGLALHQVAVDLPAKIRGTDDTTAHAAAHVIARGARVLRPSVRTEESKPGVVLIGGPGQGKTTLSQLICQLHRVALLEGLPDHKLTTPIRGLCDVFKGTLLGEIGLELPSIRRWPVHVRLDQYADAMATDHDLALLEYIANRVARRAAVTFVKDQLAEWLRNWPWLLVLDGLDEVADQRTREALLRNVEDFHVDAATWDADLFTVATTRPQGFGEELGFKQYEYVDLQPLVKHTAVRYAERLAAARYADDTETRELVVARVRDAADDERTARLMRSPLQVTIMSLLLARRSKAPRHRYELFRAYYDTVLAREIAKKTPDAELLDRHAKHINVLQEKVGLALQVSSEKEGDAEAAMPQEDVRRSAAHLLGEEGFDADTVDALAGKLVALAVHRLVLLVPKSGGGIGFEVRSLQEFMAARGLTAGPDTEILNNLRMLAPSAHWRNTWLLAAGRLFVERDSMRTALLGELSGADVADPLSIWVAPGAHLAIDLLDEGVADTSPKFQAQLAKHALTLLKKAPDLHLLRLAKTLAGVLANAQTAQIVESEVTEYLQMGGLPTLSGMMLCAVWAGETDALAGKARSWLTSAWNDLEESGGKRWVSAVALVANYPLPALRQRVSSPSEPMRPATVAEFVEPLLVQEHLGAEDRSRVQQLLKAVSEVDLWRDRVDEIEVIRADKTIIAELSRLDDPLSRPPVIKAVKDAIDKVDLPMWPVRIPIRRILGLWLERRAVGHLLLDPAISGP